MKTRTKKRNKISAAVLFAALATMFSAATTNTAISSSNASGLDMANVTFLAGDFAAAKQIFLELEANKPEDTYVLQKIADLYMLENNVQMAEAYYLRAIEYTSNLRKMWPLSVELYMNTALAYYRKDDFVNTAQYLTKAAGPLGVPLIDEIQVQINQLDLFGDVTPYIISGDETTFVSFEQLDPLPIINVRINGSAPLSFIIDTGAEEVTIDDDIATAVNIFSAGEFVIPEGVAAGGGAAFGLGKIDSIQIGGIEIKNVPTDIVDMENISQKVFGGRQIDGIIGTRFLMHFLSTIDYKNQQLILRQNTNQNRLGFDKGLSGNSYTKVPFSLFYTHLIFAQGSFNGGNEGLYLIDTGVAAAAILSSEEKYQASGVFIDWSKSVIGAGVGGKAEALSVEIDQVSIGNGSNKLTRQNLPGVLMKNELEIFNGQLGFEVNGLISHSFYKDMAITFDFENMELILEE